MIQPPHLIIHAEATVQLPNSSTPELFTLGLPLRKGKQTNFKDSEFLKFSLSSQTSYTHLGLLYFAQDAQVAQVAHWMCQCAIYAQDMRKILSQCAIYAQDLRKIVLLSPMRNICARYAQDYTSSPKRNTCARFAQDCTYFSNAQHMRKICAGLYFFPQCTIYAQDCTRLYLFLQCAIYAQDLHKIVLLSPMRNICTSFVQDLCKIVLLSPLCKDCRHYWKKYVTYHISALNLEWYSLHSYFWIATGFDFFLNKHLGANHYFFIGGLPFLGLADNFF